MIEKTVFIVTYGRSGSTLLQGLINTIDGYDIKGENYNALVPIFRSSKRATLAKCTQGRNPLDVRSPWYGSDHIDIDGYEKSMCESFLKHVLKPRGGSRVTGFKEIRYGGQEFPDVEESKAYLKFIRKNFPSPKFIFNVRSLGDVVKSGWWKDSDDSIKHLEDLRLRLQVLYEDNLDVSFLVDYDEYTENPASLRRLWDFLGEDFCVEKISNALKIRYSY